MDQLRGHKTPKRPKYSSRSQLKDEYWKHAIDFLEYLLTVHHDEADAITAHMLVKGLLKYLQNSDGQRTEKEEIAAYEELVKLLGESRYMFPDRTFDIALDQAVEFSDSGRPFQLTRDEVLEAHVTRTPPKKKKTPTKKAKPPVEVSEVESSDPSDQGESSEQHTTEPSPVVPPTTVNLERMEDRVSRPIKHKMMTSAELKVAQQAARERELIREALADATSSQESAKKSKPAEKSSQKAPSEGAAKHTPSEGTAKAGVKRKHPEQGKTEPFKVRKGK